MIAFDRFVSAAEAQGHRIKLAGPGVALVQCPAHDDGNPSLSIRQAGQQLLVYCHAGCTTEDIVAGIGLGLADLFDSPRGATYNYYDNDGRLLREVHRTPDKKFSQRVIDRGRVSLYRLPEVRAAVHDGRTVWLVEGEKDADVLASLGEESTSAPQGAQHFDLVDVTPLHGATIRAVVDLDEPGKSWAADVNTALHGHAASVTFHKPLEGKDLADHIMLGHTLDELVPLDGDELPTTPLEAIRLKFPRLDLAALLAVDRPERRWLVAGLVPMGASVSVVAPAGTGKSLLILALALSVARGDNRFAGIPTTTVRVLLVDMENSPDDLADRLAALGVTPDTVDHLERLVVLHLPPFAPLDSYPGAAELALVLDAYGMEPGDLVVLDSLQRVVAGPENDSDTLRSFYRHTGTLLKRRGLTVVRADNMGKDVERGARGTSGKRDDVDVELLMTRDASQPDMFWLRPGKTRLPGIEPLLVAQRVDDDTGLLTYNSAADPFRTLVDKVTSRLDELSAPVATSQRAAADMLKAAGLKFSRTVIRTAVKERQMSFLPVPSPHGALDDELPLNECAAPQRRTPAHPPENTDSERERCAEPERRTNGAPTAGVSAEGAPLRSLSKERRTGALTPTGSCDACGQLMTIIESGQTTHPGCDPGLTAPVVGDPS